MADGNTSNNNERAYSKEQAARYLGISVRSLEYAMEDRAIAFEKHGRRVVFHQSDLDVYRAKHRIRPADEKPEEHHLIRSSNPSTGERFSPYLPKTMLALDAEEFVKEMTADALSARGLTREGARQIFVTLRGHSTEKADEILLEYESSCFRSLEQLGVGSPKTALGRMDWSFAVADCFLDLVDDIEAWARDGKDRAARIPLIPPPSGVPTWPNRMLPCLKFIDWSEFGGEIGVAQAFFLDSMRIGQQWTHYPDACVPLSMAFRCLPESAGKKSLSFIGPTSVDALRTTLMSYFCPIEASKIICTQEISFPGIAKLCWLRDHGKRQAARSD